MGTYIVSCLVAVAIALGGAYGLSEIQKSADVAYTTTGVRL